MRRRARLARTESLGSGALVHADVLARLLGLRILRLEADIVLAPALPVVPADARPLPHPLHPPGGGSLDQARRLLADAEALTRHDD